MSAAAHDTNDTVCLDLLHVLIAFDDLPAYKRAVRLLVRVAQQLGGSIDVRPLPWQFDVIESGSWRTLASEQADNSEIVVVSTSRVGSLSGAIREWLRACCADKRESTPLLVAMLGVPDSDGVERMPDTEFLRRLAKDAGWGFLSPACSAASSDLPATATI